MSIRFRVVGLPKPQRRPSAWFNKHTGRAAVYDPKTADGWKGQVVLAGDAVRPQTCLEGPLAVELHFRLPRARGHFRTGKNAHLLSDRAPVRHTARPDVDNLAKAVLDALKNARWYADDAQIVELLVTKVYEHAAGPSGLDVEIRVLDSDLLTNRAVAESVDVVVSNELELDDPSDEVDAAREERDAELRQEVPDA